MNASPDVPSSFRCVVDASVGIKLFVPEDLSDRADALFALLGAEPPARLYVPDLFYVECANILWKYVRRLGHPPEQARQDLDDLVALVLQAVPTAELMGEAFDIAFKYSISAYDACYVALARRLGVELITADERLARVFNGSQHAVRWLRHLPLVLSQPGAGETPNR